jgi:peptide/nickel transport system permease protein
LPSLKFLIDRLLHLVPVLFGIAVVVFIMLKLAPGDPARLLVGDRASEETLAAVRRQYGLDQPLLAQFFIYITNVVQGDLGLSLRFRKPVLDLILQFLPPTLFLVTYVAAITVPLTLVLAVTAARSRGGAADHVIRILGVTGFTVPVFWLALMMSRLFAVELDWFPVSGYGDGFAAHVHHLFLPALSTAIWLVPVLVQSLRTAILDKMEADFTVAALSKGLSERWIFWRHILPNALLPTLHLFGVMLAYLIGGTIIVETIYAVPGLGRLLVTSLLTRDYYVVQGLTLFFALATVLVTLTIDIVTGIVDPRTRQ